MSFTAANMQTFSRRMERLVAALQDVREEASRLDAIYANETTSGVDPNFTDTEYASAQEHVDVITLFRDFEDFLTNQAVATADRQANLTPFLQGD